MENSNLLERVKQLEDKQDLILLKISELNSLMFSIKKQKVEKADDLYLQLDLCSKNE